uniref:Uncharacterized protein n=1 Tax=Oryza brachyantha TaxID=4533 RepID=J3N7T2_ORYBR
MNTILLQEEAQIQIIMGVVVLVSTSSNRDYANCNIDDMKAAAKHPQPQETWWKRRQQRPCSLSPYTSATCFESSKNKQQQQYQSRPKKRGEKVTKITITLSSRWLGARTLPKKTTTNSKNN